MTTPVRRFRALAVMAAVLLTLGGGCSTTGSYARVGSAALEKAERTRNLGFALWTREGFADIEKDSSEWWDIAGIEAPPLKFYLPRSMEAVHVRLCAATEIAHFKTFFEHPLGMPCYRPAAMFTTEPLPGRERTFLLHVSVVDRHQHHPPSHFERGAVAPSLTFARITDRQGLASVTGFVYVALWADLDSDRDLDDGELDLVAIHVRRWPEDERVTP